jgi:hypothetical protein
MPLLLAALILLGMAAPAWSQPPPDAARRATVPPAPSTGIVWGQVRSEMTRAPLRFAVVEVISAGLRPISTATDANGIYVLRGVPAGRRLMRVTHIDHAPNEIEIVVVTDKQHVIDFDLEFRPVRLSAVTAEGARSLPNALDTVPAQQSELGPGTLRALESTPGVAELGLAETVREVPGSEPVDPSGVLYVRGGSADLKLVTLNGAPVYAPFHIGGLIHALDAHVLRSATLHSGGAPARYDGGLSYVMDLETRSGRNRALHGEVGLDMMSARVLAEGAVGSRVSVLAAARSVHGEGTQTFMESAFPYAYGDAVGRIDLVIGAGHVVTGTVFWNDESVSLDTVNVMPQAASWGNNAGSLRYRGTIGVHEVLGTVAQGRFRTMLPVRGIRPNMTEAKAHRSRFALDIERPFAGGRLFWGGSYDKLELENRAFPQGSRDSTILATATDGSIAGVYAEAAYSVLPRVRVRAGVRADHFSRADGIAVTPRGSATVLLTDRASLTISAGQYRQYVRAPEQSLVFLGNVAPDSGSGPALRVASATHFVLGLAQDFGEGIRLGIDGFFKDFEGLQASTTTRTAASGLDLWLRRNAGELTGWLGYSLAWVWVVDGQTMRPTQAFSGRHLMSGGVVGPIIGRTEFDVRVSYGSGLPYTAIPEPETASPVFGVNRRPTLTPLTETPDVPPLRTDPQEPYIRVDAQVSRTFNGHLREFEFQFMPYLKVINALNRRDAIFYHYNRDVGRAEPLADLPVVPIVGMEWKF